jgi:hypothetical protein
MSDLSTYDRWLESDPAEAEPMRPEPDPDEVRDRQRDEEWDREHDAELERRLWPWLQGEK